jgi:membrane protein YqaA with SNARE-associated domain
MEFFQAIPWPAGLPGLFLLSFLAATILPIGSEWLLILLLMQGLSPSDVVLTASLGNFLGACTTYLLGRWGADSLLRHLLRIDDNQLLRAKNFYVRYGIWSLLLSWLPIIGDPLCLLAGLLRLQFYRFTLLVFIGKFSRYATLAFLTLKGIGDK